MPPRTRKQIEAFAIGAIGASDEAIGASDEAIGASDEADGASQQGRLSGQGLLSFYEQEKARGRSHSQIAYDAGYVTTTKAGHERVMAAQFNEAFLLAQGIDTGGQTGGGGRSHAGLSRARVSGQGILLVSQLATRSIGAVPGAVFSVEYPTGDMVGPGAQILLTMSGEIDPVIARKKDKSSDSANSTGEDPA